MHLNKALYSLSYTCLTAGASGVLLAGIYFMVRYISSHFMLKKPFDYSYSGIELYLINGTVIIGDVAPGSPGTSDPTPTHASLTSGLLVLMILTLARCGNSRR